MMFTRDVSKVGKRGSPVTLACANESRYTAIKKSNVVFFRTLMTSFPVGGMATRIACGRMIFLIIAQ